MIHSVLLSIAALQWGLDLVCSGSESVPLVDMRKRPRAFFQTLHSQIPRVSKVISLSSHV